MGIKSAEIEHGLWVISADGRIDQGQMPQFEKTLDLTLDEAPRGIIIDFAEATYINSGGLRCLVGAWRRAQREGSSLVLCGLNGRLREIIAMVGFDQVFQIYDTCAQARIHPFP